MPELTGVVSSSINYEPLSINPTLLLYNARPLGKPSSRIFLIRALQPGLQCLYLEPSFKALTGELIWRLCI